jgi:hypothetical protein
VGDGWGFVKEGVETYLMAPMSLTLQIFSVFTSVVFVDDLKSEITREFVNGLNTVKRDPQGWTVAKVAKDTLLNRRIFAKIIKGKFERIFALFSFYNY